MITCASKDACGGRQGLRTGDLMAIGLVLLLTATFLVGAAIMPPDSVLIPRCPIHSLTGFHCAGCGLARALHAALRGRFAEALSCNALPVMLAPLLLLCLRVRCQRTRRIVVAAIVAITVLFGVMRNIPCHPFTLLAPP